MEAVPVQHWRQLVGALGVLDRPARRICQHLQSEEVQRIVGLAEMAHEAEETLVPPPCRRDLCEQEVAVEGRVGFRSYLCLED